MFVNRWTLWQNVQHLENWGIFMAIFSVSNHWHDYCHWINFRSLKREMSDLVWLMTLKLFSNTSGGKYFRTNAKNHFVTRIWRLKAFRLLFLMQWNVGTFIIDRGKVGLFMAVIPWTVYNRTVTASTHPCRLPLEGNHFPDPTNTCTTADPDTFLYCSSI